MLINFYYFYRELLCTTFRVWLSDVCGIPLNDNISMFSAKYMHTGKYLRLSFFPACIYVACCQEAKLFRNVIFTITLNHTILTYSDPEKESL